MAPGVLGQTGIEVSDVIKCISDLVKPSAIISVDALAARELSRLGCTVQITDAGVAPGSGIGNCRPQISRETMGVPVMPTVISVESLLSDTNTSSGSKSNSGSKSSCNQSPSSGSNTNTEITREEQFAGLIVTPKDIDLLVSRAAKLISLAINACLFPEFSTNDILSLTG